jgi:uncharacterized protein YlaN (UPF0358 family)
MIAFTSHLHHLSGKQSYLTIYSAKINFYLSRATSHDRASINTFSDDDGEYLETCPIYHDVDTQSIYGVDVVPLRKSASEFLWKDCEKILKKFKINLKNFYFSGLQISTKTFADPKSFK